VATRTKTRKRRLVAPLHQRLVLNRYLLSLFGVTSLEELGADLKDPIYELRDEDNVSRLFYELCMRFPNLERLSPAGPTRDDLRRYDDNIVRHTLYLSHHRGESIRWKYFQYLGLLFTELFLDRFFTDAEGFRDQLNAFVDKQNAMDLTASPIDPYAMSDLRKLAFWMATGSGKTLLMHINILQFRHYLALSGRTTDINRTILITPNEGLSQQHLEEFTLSGLEVELFSKSGQSIFSGRSIEILDIHKLAESSGDKTVAVDAFEQNNLVLVDEGHRGAGGVEWKDKRDRLAERGFSFEYSATFGQAIKAAGDEDLAQEYARAVLFDYSYRYFYADGYGKDYQILNLAESEGDTEHLYLTAALLSFYQQLRIFEEHQEQFAPYGVERPLWVFVGSSVTQSVSKAEGTDIHRIVRFFSRFVANRDESLHLLSQLLSGSTGLVSDGRDIFAGKFGYLYRLHESEATILADLLERVFNSAVAGHLRVEALKGADGELSLRLGEAEPFGVINVGDAAKLAKQLGEDEGLDVVQREVSASIFGLLSEATSRVDVLIGSKKFTEGWNSYRVSSLGLMNVGRNEGSQIIQLFGRGVRLRGYGGGLQRSSAVPGMQHPELLAYLETLSIYGLRANYMQQFKQFLEEECLPTNDAREEFILPVVRFLPERPLKTIRIRPGHDFTTDGPRLTLDKPDHSLVRRSINLDCTPKLQVMVSNGMVSADPSAVAETTTFSEAHLAFLDWNQLYHELVQFKEERGWTNLAISPDMIRAILADARWYSLKIPQSALAFDGPRPLRRTLLWQDIALNLLKKYVERFYKARREEYEKSFREYVTLTEQDENFFDQYQILVQNAHQTFLLTLERVKAEIAKGTFAGTEFGTLQAINFTQHLYTPLLYLGSKDLTIKPVALNEGERDFLLAYTNQPELFTHTEMYVLRNMTRGKGVGFFEAGNFYPDFILWMLTGDRQLVTFIDPKGISRLEGSTDPKISFFETIKDIERELADESVILNSFIVSNTPYDSIAHWGLSKEELQKRHVLFQRDDRHRYIHDLITRVRQEVVSE